jgi:hypothetical protein
MQTFEAGLGGAMIDLESAVLVEDGRVSVVSTAGE